MAENTAQDIDQERAAQIRRMMERDGQSAVEHRFGEDVTGTAEYQEAQERLEREQEQWREHVKAMQEQGAYEQEQGAEGPDAAVDRVGRGAGDDDPKLNSAEQEAERLAELAQMQQEQEAEAQRQAEEVERQRQEDVQREQQEQAEQAIAQEQGDQELGAVGRDARGDEREMSASDRFTADVEAAQTEQRRRETQEREEDAVGQDDTGREKSASDRFSEDVRTAEERSRQRGGLSR